MMRSSRLSRSSPTARDGGTGGLGRAVALDLGRSAALQLYAHLAPRAAGEPARRIGGDEGGRRRGRRSRLVDPLRCPVAGVRAQAARERGTGTSGDGSSGAGGGGGLSGVSRFQVAAGRSGPRGPDRPPAAVCLRGGSWNNNAENQRPGARNRNRAGNRNDNNGFRVSSTPRRRSRRGHGRGGRARERPGPVMMSRRRRKRAAASRPAPVLVREDDGRRSGFVVFAPVHGDEHPGRHRPNRRRRGDQRWRTWTGSCSRGATSSGCSASLGPARRR